MSNLIHNSPSGLGSVTVHSPGTVANLVCGFDILGLALKEPYDVMKVSLIDEPKVIMTNKDDFNLPTEPEKNVAGVVLLSVIERLENKIGFEIEAELAAVQQVLQVRR
jgi:homoserine kinase